MPFSPVIFFELDGAAPNMPRKKTKAILGGGSPIGGWLASDPPPARTALHAWHSKVIYICSLYCIYIAVFFSSHSLFLWRDSSVAHHKKSMRPGGSPRRMVPPPNPPQRCAGMVGRCYLRAVVSSLAYRPV